MHVIESNILLGMQLISMGHFWKPMNSIAFISTML